MDLKIHPDTIVKTCSRIESGLRLAYDGIRACTFSTGAAEPPDYWSVGAIPEHLTKQMLIEKRQELFLALNDDSSDILCKKCLQWEEKKFSEVSFDKLEFINVAHFSACNLRCNYCGFTKNNHFFREKYDALKVLSIFGKDDVTFEASVDFNPGEPTLMRDLEEHLEFFRSRKIRVRLYSNGVIYSQAVYDAVKDGTIVWLIISVDAGTPGTYKRTKQFDYYDDVIKNLAKYREAEFTGKGKVAAKYIFTDDTLGDDDISGFVYAMLAIGIENIWTLYDYSLFHKHSIEGNEKYMEAYAKMYLMFEDWGVTPSHFSDGAAACAIDVAKQTMDKTKELILLKRQEKVGKNAGKRGRLTFPLKVYHSTMQPTPPDWVFNIDEVKDFISSHDKIVVAPAGVTTLKLLKSLSAPKENIMALGDLSIGKQGQKVSDIEVKSYEEISRLDYEYLVITSSYFYESITNEIKKSGGFAGKKIVRLLE